MEAISFDQLKSVVQRLNPRERVALREYLDEFKDYDEVNHLVTDFRAANPVADWEEIMTTVNLAVHESRYGKTERRIRHQRVRERSHRKTGSARART